jgi:hypothetical protein
MKKDNRRMLKLQLKSIHYSIKQKNQQRKRLKLNQTNHFKESQKN